MPSGASAPPPTLTPRNIELLYQTGTKRPTLTRPWIDPAGDALVVDKLDEVLDLLDRKQPVKVQSKQQLTRIFSDPFSEVFS